MPLPATLSGATLALTAGRFGPFLSSAGAVYVVGRDASNAALALFKSTDPSQGAFAMLLPSSSDVAGRLDAHQGGDVLHIAYGDGSGNVRYSRFDMASDTFTVAMETVQLSNVVPSPFVSITVRSTGEVCLLYAGTETHMGTVYQRPMLARKNPSTGAWTSGIVIAGSSTTNNYQAGTLVLGTGDRLHTFYTHAGTANLFHKTYTAANALGAEQTAGTTSATSVVYAWGGGAASYVPAGGGSHQVRVPYRNASGVAAVFSFASSSDSPTITATAAGGAALANTGIGFLVLSLTLDGADARHLLYADSATQDLWWDKETGSGWGTDVEILDAVTINRLSANVYTRSGSKVLAYVYDDGGTIKYNEYVLEAAPSGSMVGWHSGTAFVGKPVRLKTASGFVNATVKVKKADGTWKTL